MAAALAGMREHVAPSGGDFRKIFKRFVAAGSAGPKRISGSISVIAGARRASTAGQYLAWACKDRGYPESTVPAVVRNNEFRLWPSAGLRNDTELRSQVLQVCPATNLDASAESRPVGSPAGRASLLEMGMCADTPATDRASCVLPPR